MDAFFADFRRRTEEKWTNTRPPGFPPIPNTRWLPGLSEEEIRRFERDVGAAFPDDFRAFLRRFNGTETERSPDPPRQDLYAYPRDLGRVKDLMRAWARDWPGIREELAGQGVDVPASAVCVPLYGHRGVLCDGDPRRSTVLSISGTDAIVYGEDLRRYLEAEFP